MFKGGMVAGEHTQHIFIELEPFHHIRGLYHASPPPRPLCALYHISPLRTVLYGGQIVNGL